MKEPEHYNIKTEYFGERSDSWDSSYAVNVDRNDYGSISIELLEEKRYEPNTMVSGKRLWFDRENALLLLKDIAEALTAYPNDNQNRIVRSLDCSCKERFEDKAK